MSCWTRAANLVDGGGADLDDVERVQHRGGVLELIIDRGLVSGERVQRRDPHAGTERRAALVEPGRVGLPGAAGDEVQQPRPRLPVLVAGEVDHPVSSFGPRPQGVDVMPDVFINAESRDSVETGLIARGPG